MEYSDHSPESWNASHWNHGWGHMPPVLPLIGAFAVLYLIFASGLWLPLLLIGAFLFFFRPMMHAQWRRGGWRGHMPGRPPFEGMPFDRPMGFRPPMGHHRMGRHMRHQGRGCWGEGWQDGEKAKMGDAPDGDSFEKPKRGSDPNFV
ncbi:MAG: hypothetical protein U0670_03620 [Anaerolineae bacterium]